MGDMEASVRDENVGSKSQAGCDQSRLRRCLHVAPRCSTASRQSACRRATSWATILVLGGFTWVLGAYEARPRSRRATVRMVATRRDVLPVALGRTAVGVAIFVLAAFYPG
jgi:hypothetical protein